MVKRYRGRKDFPTQNVLAACSFDLKFTYVLPGWEGSALDARILNDALTRDSDRLVVPRGKTMIFISLTNILIFIKTKCNFELTI